MFNKGGDSNLYEIILFEENLYFLGYEKFIFKFFGILRYDIL